jgi:hypothetical protein
MMTGVGIIGALVSLMASLLIGESHAAGEEEPTPPSPGLEVEKELAGIREELTVLRQMLEKLSGEDVQ